MLCPEMCRGNIKHSLEIKYIQAPFPLQFHSLSCKDILSLFSHDFAVYLNLKMKMNLHTNPYTGNLSPMQALWEPQNHLCQTEYSKQASGTLCGNTKKNNLSNFYQQWQQFLPVLILVKKFSHYFFIIYSKFKDIISALSNEYFQCSVPPNLLLKNTNNVL